jgi:hypothetical protein
MEFGHPLVVRWKSLPSANEEQRCTGTTVPHCPAKCDPASWEQTVRVTDDIHDFRTETAEQAWIAFPSSVRRNDQQHD